MSKDKKGLSWMGMSQANEGSAGQEKAEGRKLIENDRNGWDYRESKME